MHVRSLIAVSLVTAVCARWGHAQAPVVAETEMEPVEHLGDEAA